MAWSVSICVCIFTYVSDAVLRMLACEGSMCHAQGQGKGQQHYVGHAWLSSTARVHFVCTLHCQLLHAWSHHITQPRAPASVAVACMQNLYSCTHRIHTFVYILYLAVSQLLLVPIQLQGECTAVIGFHCCSLRITGENAGPCLCGGRC